MSQNARDRVVADFRAGRVPVLLATNVAARGLDVLSIEQVINFELPESAELFTHRIGRTGRMDREGEAITLITPEDMPAWQKIRRDLGGKLQPRPWPQDEMPLPEVPALSQPAPTGAPAGRPMQGANRPARAADPANARTGEAGRFQRYRPQQRADAGRERERGRGPAYSTRGN